MFGDMKARVPTLPLEIAELLKPCTNTERVGFIEGALLGTDRVDGCLSDKWVSVIRTASGFSVAVCLTGDGREEATYTFDSLGKHLDTQRRSQWWSELRAKTDAGDIILRQLPNLERTT